MKRKVHSDILLLWKTRLKLNSQRQTLLHKGQPNKINVRHKCYSCFRFTTERTGFNVTLKFDTRASFPKQNSLTNHTRSMLVTYRGAQVIQS